MPSPPSFFWTQSDTIKFRDFGFRNSPSCHSFAPTPRHPPIKKKERQLWERQGQTAKSPKLNKKHVCNHGNLRVPPQCHPPKKLGLIKGLLTIGFPDVVPFLDLLSTWLAFKRRCIQVTFKKEFRTSATNDWRRPWSKINDMESLTSVFHHPKSRHLQWYL